MCNRENSSRRVDWFFSAKLYDHQGADRQGGGRTNNPPPPSTGEGGEITENGRGLSIDFPPETICAQRVRI